MHRSELADFLRCRRARLAPADVGLTPGPRRRTPGLRREEVARLTGMSPDYYTRLEQARVPRPSRRMLTALARALRLTDAERDHLFRLAGEEPPHDPATAGHIRPGLLRVLDRLHDTPAQVVTDGGEVLARNTMAAALLGDLTARPPGEREERAEGRSPVRRFRHPAVGELELECEVLLSADHGQRLIVYTARPGSDSAERLELLRVVGLQDLAPSE
ncbi:MmyB family transcriptional regulator [Streptomyces coffeae]|uniref:Helix-turn-helix domain-containing protein n=1 Tax=Streptomyces coffeae TaxID=621382 RepID=A0ABS1N938_9ACTN|nr:helix-turn-helix domain-containing protein [Streptomyces coffeae]MBL1096597.1 helix-turn-helix domain-containing protein [Streptomyces coffeae]